jgi:hypothetical protein
MNSSPFPLQAAHVAALHDAYNHAEGWPDVADFSSPETLSWGAALQSAVIDNHRCNARLWCEEDLARRQLAPDGEIVSNKRNIDAFNQARNNAIERIDEWLLLALGLVDPDTVATACPVSRVAPGARLNSETAGSMIDRLSIVSLKVRAMALQTARTDVDAGHIADATSRLQRLNEQRTDLCACLDELIASSMAGRAYFKVYRQFKMYNDPAYNAVLVQERQQAAAASRSA